MRVIVKRCIKCGQEKALDAFNLVTVGKLRRRTDCKACQAVYIRAYRAVHRVELVAANRAYNRTPERRAVARRYHADHRDDRAVANQAYSRTPLRRAAQKRLRESAHGKIVIAARNAVNHAVTAGTLTRPTTCPECGGDGNGRVIEAHHHKGYDREVWLDVAWLCRRCHVATEQLQSAA
jgi:hypothetical protein